LLLASAGFRLVTDWQTCVPCFINPVLVNLKSRRHPISTAALHSWTKKKKGTEKEKIKFPFNSRKDKSFPVLSAIA